jgi:hypothetical protein
LVLHEVEVESGYYHSPSDLLLCLLCFPYDETMHILLLITKEFNLGLYCNIHPVIMY